MGDSEEQIRCSRSRSLSGGHTSLLYCILLASLPHGHALHVRCGRTDMILVL